MENRKFSIVLPVRNGGSYLRDAVNSVLSQLYPHFTLHILENGSTDGTAEWLTTITDPRVEITPATGSLVIEENWARILQLQKHDYVTTLGHDDLLHPEYLETMNSLIDSRPDASLYQTGFNLIDERGMTIRSSKPNAEILKASDFLTLLLSNNYDMMGTGFMMRSSDYDALGGIPLYPSLLFADFELYVELTRMRYMASSPKVTFSYRLHQSTTRTSPDTKMHAAFDRFMHYLEELAHSDKALNAVIQQHGALFLSTYCKGLSHRLLRTPLNKRGGLSIEEFLTKCKTYASKLLEKDNFNPLKDKSVRLALMLDRSSIGRKLFLLFKKFYSKPVLK